VDGVGWRCRPVRRLGKRTGGGWQRRRLFQHTHTFTPALRAERIRRPDSFAQRLYEAAMAQTVSITGAQTAAQWSLSRPANWPRSWLAVTCWGRRLRKVLALPAAAILRSPPGIGPRIGRIAVEIGSITTRFRTPSHLAAYAGLGPRPGNRARPSTRTCPAISATVGSRVRCSWPPSPASGTRRRGPTTTASARRASATTRPYCASRGGGSTSSAPCSAAVLRTGHPFSRRQLLDKQDRSPPKADRLRPVDRLANGAAARAVAASRAR
jgi:hypothetical protein